MRGLIAPCLMTADHVTNLGGFIIMSYAAYINVPGYMPETDVPETGDGFDTPAEAWAYLRDEYVRVCEEADADPDPDVVRAMTEDHDLGTLYTENPAYQGEHDQGLAWTVDTIEAGTDDVPTAPTTAPTNPDDPYFWA